MLLAINTSSKTKCNDRFELFFALFLIFWIRLRYTNISVQVNHLYVKVDLLYSIYNGRLSQISSKIQASLRLYRAGLLL